MDGDIVYSSWQHEVLRNLQNQPSRNKEAKTDIRNLFIADPECVFVEADYSQLEYRMIALLSQDPYLINCYREGRDLHGETARDGWGDGYTKANRSSAKTFNFALLYGASEDKLQRDGTHGVDPEIVHKIASAFFSKMPKVVEYNEKVKQLVLEQGYVESLLGRKRRFPELVYVKNDRYRVSEIFRQAINMIPQSSASDATLASIIALDKLGLSVRMTVHDSITACVPEKDAEDAVHELSKCMENTAAELFGDTVPFPVEAERGYRWGSLIVEEED